MQAIPRTITLRHFAICVYKLAILLSMLYSFAACGTFEIGLEPISTPTEGSPVVTAISTPTDAPSQTPAPTATSQSTQVPTPTEMTAPKLGNFRFCDRPCSEPGARELGIFPEGTGEVFISWDYSGMRPGLAYTRVWRFGDQEWVRYNCTWQGPENGTFELRLWDTGGLRSGVWTMIITLQDVIATRVSVVIAGNNTYWAPAGTLPCPDF